MCFPALAAIPAALGLGTSAAGTAAAGAAGAGTAAVGAAGAYQAIGAGLSALGTALSAYQGVQTGQARQAAARPAVIRAIGYRSVPLPDVPFDDDWGVIPHADGRVTDVVRVVDPATRTFIVEAEIPNRDERLKPGLFARVELDLVSKVH